MAGMMIGGLTFEVWVFWGIFVSLLILFVWSLIAVTRTRRRAIQAGFKGVNDYMLAAPRNDQERREAINMTFRGLVFCALGIVFSPLMLFGLVPLYYGGRKITLAMLGMDLLGEADGSDRHA